MKKVLPLGFVLILLVLLIANVFYGFGTNTHASESNSKSRNEIVKVTLGQNTLFIPRLYFDSPFLVEESAIRLIVFNSDFDPLPDSPEMLWDHPDWDNHISMLMQAYPKPISIDQNANSLIKFFKAYKVIGEEYGLIRRAQQDGIPQDGDDIWLEKDRADSAIKSFIVCREKYNEIVVPKCDQYVQFKGIHIQNNFDKRLLPEWKKIKDNTVSLIQSFENETSSQTLLQNNELKR